MKKLLIGLLLISSNAMADVTATVTLGPPVAGFPVDEVILVCFQSGIAADRISLTDMDNLVYVYTDLPDGTNTCTAEAVSNVNATGSPVSSDASPNTVFQVLNGSVAAPATGPNTPLAVGVE